MELLFTMYTTYFPPAIFDFNSLLERLTNLHSKSVVYLHARSAQQSGFSDFVMLKKWNQNRRHCHYITNPNKAPFFGNPSKLPYICIVWFPWNGSQLMIPPKNHPGEMAYSYACFSSYPQKQVKTFQVQTTPETHPSWWFQPIWKILVRMGIFPK